MPSIIVRTKEVLLLASVLLLLLPVDIVARVVVAAEALLPNVKLLREPFPTRKLSTLLSMLPPETVLLAVVAAAAATTLMTSLPDVQEDCGAGPAPTTTDVEEEPDAGTLLETPPAAFMFLSSTDAALCEGWSSSGGKISKSISPSADIVWTTVATTGI